MTLGRPRLHLRVCASTNDRARELAAAGAPQGALITAAEQTAGRGRQGRRWTAPPGDALLMSLVLRELSPLLPLAAAVATAEVCGDDARIKWPNDIWLPGDRKVAGILAEGRPQEGWAVLGIGINVAVAPEAFPAELRDTAGTLARPRAEVEPVLAELLAALQRALVLPAPELLAAWRRRDALAGREVRWADGHGTAAGVDEDGHLVVELPDGRRTSLNAAEVHLLR
jgi:BirA family biotin operon repressor/biotin-[acetyl-CoA-carboxylase] ligase